MREGTQTDAKGGECFQKLVLKLEQNVLVTILQKVYRHVITFDALSSKTFLTLPGSTPGKGFLIVKRDFRTPKFLSKFRHDVRPHLNT